MKMRNVIGKPTAPAGRHAKQKVKRPPIAPARVAVLKANYKQAWLYFFFIISLIIAWGIPIRYLVARRLAFRAHDMGARDATTFVALAYEGISDDPQEVSPERFREQLAALREAGYRPITLEDVHAFYAEGRLLPRNAILMTFDHSRKSSYFDARSPLGRAGWPAVMFLWTLPIEIEDPAGLRWPYVRAMIRSGAWEAGAQSHRGFESILADSEGSRRNFLTAPMWIPNEMRYESPDAFRDRLRDDHEFVRNLIERETGTLPRAFAFPYGDFGQHDERAILSRRLNMDIVGALYDLGFIHGDSALNTQFSDPRRLNRLLVRPEWTGADLLDHLANAWPRPNGIQGREAFESERVWMPTWGQVTIEPTRIGLDATAETTGATTWMHGSDLFGDISTRFRLRIERGQVGLYFRATPDGERHIFLGLGHDGEVWLRQKQAGLPAVTLAHSTYVPDADGWIHLEVDLRGPLLIATLSGQPLFDEFITLRGSSNPGKLGISIWDPVPFSAVCEFTELTATPLRNSILTWPISTSRDSRLPIWFARNAVLHSHMAPPWLKVESRSRSEQFGWDPHFFRTLAAAYTMQFTPEVLIDNMDIYDESLPGHLAIWVAEMGADGVYCNLGELTDAPPLARITTFIQEMSHELQERNLNLIVRLPPEWERESTISALVQSIPHLTIALGPRAYHLFAGDHPQDTKRFIHTHTADISDIRMPQQHLLRGLEATDLQWETEVRGKRLRQQGFEAFEQGRFDDALEIWTRWSVLEPQNPEPPRLIGDVHWRRNDHTRAIAAYQDSLERNPGQIGLVTQTAHLMDQWVGRDREAAQLLALYSRLFPANPDIRLAQAQFLIRRNRPVEAGELVLQVVRDNPDDINARAMLHGLLNARTDRMDNMSAILEIGQRPGMASHFADAVKQHDLLTWPESWILMPFIEEQATAEATAGRPGSFQRLQPRQSIAIDTFRMRNVTDNWMVLADSDETEGESFILAAGPASSEATLRLANSDAMHSGFIETEIGDSRGDFWLYARRGQGSMIRFGFQQANRMHLQIWRHGDMIHNLQREWRRDGRNVRLRLEVRGDAAFGYIDGEPAFGAPARIPNDMGLGWWGFSPWAAQFGVAQVVMREIAGGPVPVTFAAFESRTEQWSDAELIDAIRDHVKSLQAIAPQWYVQEVDGLLRRDYSDPYRDLRLMLRFNQIRLLPAVRSAIPSTLDLEELIRFAERERVEGFTLLVTRMPDESWFTQAEQRLLNSDLSMIALRIGDQGTAEIREFGPRVSIFSGPRAIRTVPLVEMKDETEEIDDTEAPTPVQLPVRALDTPLPPDRILYF